MIPGIASTAEDTNELAVVTYNDNPEQAAFVVCNPALVSLTWQKLVNKQYVKLSGAASKPVTQGSLDSKLHAMYDMLSCLLTGCYLRNARGGTCAHLTVDQAMEPSA